MALSEIVLLSLLSLRNKMHTFCYILSGSSHTEFYKMMENQYKDINMYLERISIEMALTGRIPSLSLDRIIELSIDNNCIENISHERIPSLLKEEYISLIDKIHNVQEDLHILNQLGEYLSRRISYLI